MSMEEIIKCFQELNKPTLVASVRLGTSKIAETNVANPHQLPKDYPAPRDVIRQHFPRTAKQCLFRGGWGYSIDDAVEVLEFDPEINPDQRFDGVSLEYAFVDKRIREELIHAPNARRFDHLSWQVIEQSLHERDGIHYDRLLVEITADDEIYLTEYWFNISDFY